jgi:hypothetical protein
MEDQKHTLSVCSALAAFIILFPVALLVSHFNSSASNVLLNSWIRMRGKRMSYSVSTRCSMKMPNSLTCTTSLQSPLFQVTSPPSPYFLLDLFFEIVKAVSYHYTLITTKLPNSRFSYHGNRCHQWNKWDYNYLRSGIYCFIHIPSGL